SYPAQLQAMLAAHGHIYQVVNQGRSGSTTRMALNNLHRGMMLQPKIVLVALGGNDRSNRMGSGETRENLRKIISMYVRTGAIVFLADRNPRSDGSEPEGASLFAELAAEEGAMLMPSLRQDIAGKQEFLLADMSHPNAAGYTIVAERIHALLEPHL